MRKLLVPEGKVLHIKAGDYWFYGPCEIPVNTKFQFPDTYEDGTLVEYTDSKKRRRKRAKTKPDLEVSDPAQSLDSPVCGQGDEGVGADSQELRGSDSVRECTGEDHGT